MIRPYLGALTVTLVEMESAREAVKLIKIYISEKISFNQETTLSGKSIIKNIKLAKENGFYIVMNYIGVKNPEIAKDRVKIRVNKGGHGISDDTIETRYCSLLKNLKAVIKVCDEITIYDNTEIFKEILDYKDGNLIWEDKNMPNSANNLLDK
ncbi:MAG: ATPase [Clostridiaceae bacterium]|nr:ATPase [Clostridiaceae bacterium]